MAAPHVTDAQRKELEAAVAAALLLIYAGAARKTLQAAGIDGEPVISAEAEGAIRVFAHEQSVLDQEGINIRITALLQTVTEPDAADAMLLDLRNGFLDYWNTDKSKYLASQAFHQGQHDTLVNTNGPDGKPLAETQLYTWSKNTNWGPDVCDDAAALGPSPYNDLIDVAGTPPPVHRGCACDVSPA